MKYLLVITILLVGCESSVLKKGSNDATKKIFYYPDGKIQTIKYFKDSLLSGQSFWFYPNGTMMQIATYVQGKANGLAYFFYESGALQSCRIYSEDKLVGYTVNYFDKSVDLKKSIFLFNDSGQLYYKKEFDTLGNVIREEGRLPN